MSHVNETRFSGLLAAITVQLEIILTYSLA